MQYTEPDPALPASRFIWGGVVGIICISPLFAYGLPANPLEAWPWTRGFTDFVAGLIPGIDQLAAVSEMPQVTRVLMAMLWVTWGPIALACILIYGRVTKESVVFAMRAMRASWWSVALSLPLMATGAWILVAMPNLTDDSSSLLRWMADLMGRSRFWLGLCGSAIVFSGAFAIAACLKSFSLIRLAYAMRASSAVYRKDPK